MRILRKFFTAWYRPMPEKRSFLDRAQSKSADGLDVTVAALSSRESERYFDVRMARRGMQPIWIHVVNGSESAVRLDFFGVDPTYHTPLEAAFVNHRATGKRLVSFGLLGFLFLPLVPLLVWKFFAARWANRRMNEFFRAQGFRTGPIRPGSERSGFVFGSLDEGVKSVRVQLPAGGQRHDFAFSIDVPGLEVSRPEEDAVALAALEAVDEAGLRAWIREQPRATSNRSGNKEGDPLNLVVVGNRSTVLQCFGARWDEAEAITFKTCLKTMKAFLFDAEYRYSPVSSLFLSGQAQELALQRARGSINERIHLRLWRTAVTLGGEQVWIGQISRDIGVRFTPKTWNLTTHKIDADVDESRDYVIDYLTTTSHLAHYGYAAGVEEAPPDTPRRNLTGDPYFTDGYRAVLILSPHRTEASFLDWA